MSTETDCYVCDGLGSFPRDEAGVTSDSCKACHGRGVRETAEVIATLEAEVKAATGHDMDGFSRDPGGELYAGTSYDDVDYPHASICRRIELWLELTGESVHEDILEGDRPCNLPEGARR